MIDTHVHLIDPDRFPFPPGSGGYVPGSDEVGTLEQLLDVMAAHGISKTVIVAASVYGADNSSMLAAVAEHADQLRIVAGVDPDDETAMERLAAIPGVAGVRFNVNDDRRFADGSGLIKRLLRQAADTGLVVSLLAPPSLSLNLLAGNDDVQVVLDHLGRPDLDGGPAALKALSQRPGTWLKVSGGFRIARGADWMHPDPALKQVVEAFPADRLIWGSDWPFINLRDDTRPTYRDCLEWGRELSGADFYANAEALFWGRE